MGELHANAHLEKPGVYRGSRRRHVDAQRVGRAAEQRRVAKRLRGGGQDEQLGIGREQPETLNIAVLDLAGHRLTGGQPESAGQAGRLPGTRQLKKRERVAVALRDDLLGDGRVDRAVHVS